MSIVGDWQELIGHVFSEPMMHELQEAISRHKNNPFSEFNSYDDYFEVFKKTPMLKTKVLYVVETPVFNPDLLRQIEDGLFDINLDLTSEPDYDWLLEQGVMIFPRHLSWDRNKKGHREWRVFTDEVIRLLTFHHETLLIATSDHDLRTMLKELRPNIYTIGQGAGCWSEIDRYIAKHYSKGINFWPSKK